MKIIVAADSFKGNMIAADVCAAIEEGILKADESVQVFSIPLADGGEGTAALVTHAAGGRFIKGMVTGPFGDMVEAEFGLIENDRVAVIDVASASGIDLVNRNSLNPMKASSFGTGELIVKAMDAGAEEIIIGLGGSAVNDGGLGMLSALGFKALDSNGNSVGQGGEALTRIAEFDISGADKRLNSVKIQAACDVSNPLLGINGASFVFGPQKGATTEMVKELDAGLQRLANAWIKSGLAEDAEQPGDGAAGGIGAALRICMGASMESGAMLVMRYTGFLEKLKHADLVITGEGMTDAQTASGKLCAAIACECRKAGVPVVLLSGAIAGKTSELLSTYNYAASISCGQIGLDAMIADSRRDLAFAAENLIRAMKIGQEIGVIVQQFQ
ncbi:MAG: glycerate kinase [Treponema sp.]|nr:glycerate kinase [Treponema sp.]